MKNICILIPYELVHDVIIALIQYVLPVYIAFRMMNKAGDNKDNHSNEKQSVVPASAFR